MIEILTVGHGDLPIERLLHNLRGASIDRVVDVRSVPYSKRHPQFNSKVVERAVREAEIEYVWEPALGGRPPSPALMTGGKPDYDKMAREDSFREAVDRLVDSSEYKRTAVMCSEGHPERCHRWLLVAPALIERGAHVRHVLKQGEVIELEYAQQAPLLV